MTPFDATTQKLAETLAAEYGSEEAEPGDNYYTNVNSAVRIGVRAGRNSTRESLAEAQQRLVLLRLNAKSFHEKWAERLGNHPLVGFACEQELMADQVIKNIVARGDWCLNEGEA